jgi:large subunit ribosomal protein L6
MSRVGKNPVSIPSGVEINLTAKELHVKGKLGNLSLSIHDTVTVEMENESLLVKIKEDNKQSRMMWGTTRNLINNMVKGVTEGFSCQLDINGVGYRAAIQGKNLVLQLGFSHDVIFPIPSNVNIKCDKPTEINVSGIDKQAVNQVAANIREYKKPEPYKGKGIKYRDEVIYRKEGKKK